MEKTVPILFFNTNSESKEAYLLIKSAGLDCRFRAPCLEERVPILLIGYQKLFGINEIKDYVLRR